MLDSQSNFTNNIGGQLPMIKIEDITLGQRLYRLDEVRGNMSVGIVSRLILGQGTLDPSTSYSDRDFLKPTTVGIGFFGRDGERLQGIFGTSKKSQSSDQHFSESAEDLIEHIGKDKVKAILNVDSDEDLQRIIDDLNDQNSFEDRNILRVFSKKPAIHLSKEDTKDVVYNGPPLGAEAFTVIMEKTDSKTPIWIAQTWVAEISLSVKDDVVKTDWRCYKPDVNRHGKHYTSLNDCYEAIEQDLAAKGMSINRDSIPYITVEDDYKKWQEISKRIYEGVRDMHKDMRRA